MPKKILVIPDCQIKAGVSTRHLGWIGRYIADKRPEILVQIGDFADMPSLSSYDTGKKSFEGRRYKKDVEASVRAMVTLTAPFKSLKGYNPRMVLTLGNHEDRITRAVESDPKLDGTIGLSDLKFEDFGWKVVPFLKPIRIEGIDFCHYFVSGAMGRPVSSAASLLRERMRSAVQGHSQFTDISFHKKTRAIGLFVGTCYLHTEPYLTFQGNSQRRQIVMLHEVRGGTFDVMFVSLSYLARKYGHTRIR